MTITPGLTPERRVAAILAIATVAHKRGALFPTRTALGKALGCSRMAANDAVMKLQRTGHLRLEFSGLPVKRRMVVKEVRDVAG